MGKLDGKVAVITGGSAGIGFAAAKRLVADGAYVFITGRRQEGARCRVRRSAGTSRPSRATSRSSRTWTACSATVKESKGRIDILFANAGIAEAAPLGDITEELFDRTFGANVKGALLHGAEGAAAPARRRLDHLHLIHRRVERESRRQRVQRHQGGAAIVRAHPHHRPQGPQDPRQRRQPGSDRHGRAARPPPHRQRRPERPLPRQDPARPPRSGPNDIASAVSFLASDDSSYIAGIELFRRRRIRAGLSRADVIIREAYVSIHLAGAASYASGQRQADRRVRRGDAFSCARFPSRKGRLRTA